MSVKLLILGKGWAGAYIATECATHNVQYAATTRDGRDGTLPFDFRMVDQYARLPLAEFIIVTFPLRGVSAVDHLISNYVQTHACAPRWILLGSTGVFKQSEEETVIDRHSPIEESDERGIAETRLMSQYDGVVLSCSGLWGGERHPSKWISRVASNKDELMKKGALHLIHGVDIALSLLKLMDVYVGGERWVLTDLRVYDWWDIALAYAPGTYGEWVRELLVESSISYLPRSSALLVRTIDGRDYWDMLRSAPRKSLLANL